MAMNDQHDAEQWQAIQAAVQRAHQQIPPAPPTAELLRAIGPRRLRMPLPLPQRNGIGIPRSKQMITEPRAPSAIAARHSIPWAALVLAVLMSVVGVVLFAELAPHRGSVAIQPTPTLPVLHNSHLRLPAGTGPAGFTGTVMLAPNDVWTEGAYHGAQGLTAFIAQYDGDQWRVTDLPASLTADLHTLAMYSDAAGYAGGDHDLAISQPKPLLLRYDGQQWRQIPVPLARGFSIEAIQLFGPDTGWMLALNTLTGGAVVLWLDHGTLTPSFTLPTARASNTFAMSMATDSDGWLAIQADLTQPSELWHNHNGQWTQATPAEPALIRDIQMLTPGDGWASGCVWHSVGSSCPTAIYHFDGTSWQNANVPTGLLTPTDSIVGLGVAPGDEVWVEALDSFGPVPAPRFWLHYAHQTWTQQPIADLGDLHGNLLATAPAHNWAAFADYPTGVIELSLGYDQNGVWSSIP